LTIKDCRIASVGLCTAPFITSYIGHFDRFLFADNVCENSYPALCNFQIPTGAKQVEQLRWVVRMLAPPFGRRSFARLTNTDKVVHLDDPWGAVGA